MVGGCGDNSFDRVPFDDFSAEARFAICDWSVRCGHVPNRETCERLIDPKDYDDSRARDSIARGRSVYDSRAGARCIGSTREAFCLSTPFSDPSCLGVFRGQNAEGSPCTSVRECAGTADCVIESCPGQCCEGVCGAASMSVPNSAGSARSRESCTGHNDCVIGTYCETDRTCREFPTREGQRCLIGCARGDLYCDVGSLTCKRFAALDELCAESVDEPGLPCDPAFSVCDEVCRPRPGLGEPCNQTDRLCIATTLCDEATRTCVPRRELGQQCETGRDCNAECDRRASVCVAYSPCE